MDVEGRLAYQRVQWSVTVHARMKSCSRGGAGVEGSDLMMSSLCTQLWAPAALDDGSKTWRSTNVCLGWRLEGGGELPIDFLFLIVMEGRLEMHGLL